MKAFHFEKLSGALEDNFRLLDVVAGTMTAQAYRAVDLLSNQNVTVWRTRGPLVMAEVARCEDRLRRVEGAHGVQPILRAGVDSHNVGFAVLPAYDARRLDSRAKNIGELEARFDGCVRIVESLHERSVVCGDLCLDSFVVNDRGKVSLLAVLGDLSLASEGEEFNRDRYLAFRPPEQKPGAPGSAGWDLYALGWIGDGLFACDVTEKEETRAPPRWLKNILQATATQELRAKASSAKALRLVIEEESSSGAGLSGEQFALMELESEPERQEQEEQRDAGAISRDSPGVKKEEPEEVRADDGGYSKVTNGGFSGGRQGDVTERLSGVVAGVFSLISSSSRVLLLAMANLAALGILLISFWDVRSSGVREDSSAIAEVDRLASVRETLRNLYLSDAPNGHVDLIEMLKSSEVPEVKREALRVLIFRSRRLGLSRSADVVRGSFFASSDSKGLGVNDSSAAILRSLDPALDQTSRVKGMTDLYDTEPKLTTVLSAALALDSKNAEPYRGILARAVADQVGVFNGGEHSPHALMLLLPDVHDLFSEDLVEISESIPSDDIEWLLEELGNKGRSEISTVAQLASNRDVVSGPNAVFLKELQRSAALSEGLRMSLVSGILGKLSLTDIKRFGEWYGQASPRVLEASIITARDSQIREAAFEALRSKPLADAYMAKVMEFLDSSYGGDSSKYGGLVAVVALREIVDEQTTAREFNVIQNAPRARELLKQLVTGAPPEMLLILLQRYSSSMDPLDVVDLLSHPAKEVRKTAVTKLSDTNDIMLMKLISQGYDDERDPEVRAVYETQIRVIRDRGKGS